MPNKHNCRPRVQSEIQHEASHTAKCTALVQVDCRVGPKKEYWRVTLAYLAFCKRTQ
jgi:hypothetical protein